MGHVTGTLWVLISDLKNKEVSWVGSGLQTRLNMGTMWILYKSGSLVNYRSSF